MKITAKTTSPNTMPLRTLSAASTTNVVSTANTAPLIPIWVADGKTQHTRLCGSARTSMGPAPQLR